MTVNTQTADDNPESLALQATKKKRKAREKPHTPTREPLFSPHHIDVANVWANCVELLKKARVNDNRSQEAVAAAVGVSTPTVGAWERFKVAPRLDELIRWCWALGVEPCALFEEGTLPNPEQMAAEIQYNENNCGLGFGGGE